MRSTLKIQRLTFACASLILIPSLCFSQHTSGPMAQQAHSTLALPAKVDVQPVKQGRTTNLRIVLLNADGLPAKATEDTSVQVKSTSASGKTATTTVQIPAGSN